VDDPADEARERAMLLREQVGSSPPAAGKYRTAPLRTRGYPPGVRHIIVNECAERFSFYGMKAILTIFLTHRLALGESTAREWYHAFNTAVYFTPLVGAVSAEVFLGKYRTIMGFSLVYCAGHLALALNESKGGLVLGLSLIAVGAGGIKPCVSTMLGDQFGESNAPLMSSAFAAFYWAINLGAFASTLTTPALLECCGSHVAFGVPGALMGLATLVFWLGRRSYAHIPPHGKGFVQEACSRTGQTALGKLVPLFGFIAAFWSLYDQTGSAWVLQAEQMECSFLGVTWLPSQVAAINPLLILILVPIFNGFTLPLPRSLSPTFCLSALRLTLRLTLNRDATAVCTACRPARYVRVHGVYERVGRHVRVTPLRKISCGLFVLAASFVAPLLIEHRISAGEHPSIGWQLLAYVLLTAAEVLVSVTGLEFAYSQAPPRMKSAVSALFLLSTSLGNLFTMIVNAAITNPDGSTWLSNVGYYGFFVALMLIVAVAFVPFAACYTEQSYIQHEEGGHHAADASAGSGSDDASAAGVDPPAHPEACVDGEFGSAHGHSGGATRARVAAGGAGDDVAGGAAVQLELHERITA